jgi:hypothetical protein
MLLKAAIFWAACCNNCNKSNADVTIYYAEKNCDNGKVGKWIVIFYSIWQKGKTFIKTKKCRLLSAQNAGVISLAGKLQTVILRLTAAFIALIVLRINEVQEQKNCYKLKFMRM